MIKMNIRLTIKPPQKIKPFSGCRLCHGTGKMFVTGEKSIPCMCVELRYGS